MRNEYLTREVLRLLQKGHTQKEIAISLRKHYNTIYKHVKKIRETQVTSLPEIVNYIDDRLRREIDQMSHRDLINYRRQLTIGDAPLDVSGSITLTWKKPDATADSD